MDGAGVCHYHVVEAPLEKEYVILLRMMSMMVMEVVIPAQSWPECMLRLEWIIEKCVVSDCLEDRYFFVHCCRPIVCLAVAQGSW